MNELRVHKLVETLPSGEKRQIGGAITDMNIVGFTGSLTEVSVEPVTEEEREEHGSVEFVRLQVADRIVWMSHEEAKTLYELLLKAYDASLT